MLGTCRKAVLLDIYDGIYDAYKELGVYCYCMPAHKHETAYGYEDRVLTSLAPCAHFKGLPWAALVLHQGLLDDYAKEAQGEKEEPIEYACAVMFIDGTRCICDADEDKAWIIKTAVQSLDTAMTRALPDTCAKCGQYLIAGRYQCPDCQSLLCMPCMSSWARCAKSTDQSIEVLSLCGSCMLQRYDTITHQAAQALP